MTERQHQLKAAMDQLIEAGLEPSTRKLAKVLGCSQYNVWRMISGLRKKGQKI